MVGADPLGELRVVPVQAEVDVEALAQERHAGVGDLLLDEDAVGLGEDAHAAAGTPASRNTFCAAPGPAPCSTSRPSWSSTISRPGERRHDVERAEVAAVGDPQDPALEVVLAAVGGDAELAQAAGHLAAVDVVRQLDGGHDRRALVRVAEQVEPHRGDAGAGGAGEQVVAGEDVVQALLLDQAERDVEPEEQRHGGRERARALALALGGAAPVEVVAAFAALRRVLERALGDRREGEPGRAHQRLLRAGDDDVDAPLVLAQLGGAEARHGVDRRGSRRACGRPRRSPGRRARCRSRSR